MSTPKLGSFASAALYFCGTAMLAAAILLIPFVYKPAVVPCECPPALTAALPPGAGLAQTPPVPPPPGDAAVQEATVGSNPSPAPKVSDTVPKPPTPVASPAMQAPGATGQASEGKSPTSIAIPSKWRFEVGEESALNEEQVALALKLGEALKIETKARATVTGLYADPATTARAKKAARLVRDEVAAAGISSKRMSTDIAQDAAASGQVVVFDIILPQ